MSNDAHATTTATLFHTGGERDELLARHWTVEVVEGPESGTSLTRDSGRIIVGSHADCDLILSDKAVSRNHVELRLRTEGVLVIDLGSRNGTHVGGERVEKAFVTPGVSIHIGKTVLRVRPVDKPVELRSEGLERFGEFASGSERTRKLLAMLRVAAGSDATILIEGETGTGKELLARAVHEHSPRAKKSFIVVDCGAVVETLLESHLFGHKKGSFTGATQAAIGAFEAARGGTVFLDELGELPRSLQPKLLRALEARTVLPIGEVEHRPIDVRFIAATNRDLKNEASAGSFRDDLFYRVAVVRAHVAPLRERPEDISLLARLLIEQLGKGRARLSSASLVALEQYDWPGNARELRNVLERALATTTGTEIGPDDLFPDRPLEAPPNYHQSRDAHVEEFEKRYVRMLLARCDRNVTRAAKEAGLSRHSLYALMRRTGMTPKADD